MISMLSPIINVFTFDKNANLSDWWIVDDTVMGGRSDGNFIINKDGDGEFYGKVSLENNGGFSMVRYDCGRIELSGHRKILLRVKGDGKKYQFRIKTNASDYYSYIAEFKTSDQWETIEIDLNQMYPAFRGMKLNIGNFYAQQIEQIAILIGNKKPEDFKLLIKEIKIK